MQKTKNADNRVEEKFLNWVELYNPWNLFRSQIIIPKKTARVAERTQ
jgi:hypothetical protein